MELELDMKQLRALLAIAETGSVSRAAELLHIVQPAVSRQLRLLEENLGTALFERGRRGMELTEAGQLMVHHARRALHAAHAVAHRRLPAARLFRFRPPGLVMGTAWPTAQYAKRIRNDARIILPLLQQS